MSEKVKIQYGIFGGEGSGRRLRKALQQAGYVVTKKVAEADIIMAHSAGCFWLPDASSGQKIMLIDPPYWPERSIADRRRTRIRRNFQFSTYAYPPLQWVTHNLWGVYYGVRDHKRTKRIIRHAPTYNLEQVVKNRPVLLVRNEHDDWLTPDLDAIQRTNPKLRVVHVPGDHDDIIYHPKRYVELLKTL